MTLQYLAGKSSFAGAAEALPSQIATSHRLGFETSVLWAMLPVGGYSAIQAPKRGQAPRLTLRACQRDRRSRCRNPLRACWPWAWLSSLQPAHRPSKKNMLSWSLSRSRLSPCTQANTSNSGSRRVIQERAARRPVPVCPRPFDQGSRPC